MLTPPPPPLKPGEVPQATPSGDPLDRKFIIEDSPLKASITTALSLLFFGVTLAVALMKLLSAHDINGIRALLMREDVLGWLTMAAPIAWGAYRTARTWFKTKISAAVADASPNAVLRSDVIAAAVALASQAPPPLTRAREMTTRLVDPAVLHRGGLAPAPETVLAAGMPDVATDPIEIPIEGWPGAGPRQDDPLNSPEFDAAYREWLSLHGDTPEGQDFNAYLREKGWSYVDKRWQPPADTSPQIPGDALGAPPRSNNG